MKNAVLSVLLDPCPNWPEVFTLKKTTTEKVVIVLEDLCARYELCNGLISDDNPQFVSEDFKTFVSKKLSCTYGSAPAHRQSNGQAERSVETVIVAIKKSVEKGKILNFLSESSSALP